MYFRMKYTVMFFILLIISGLHGYAQDTLSLDEAIEVTLKNNFQVRISRQSEQVLQNNADKGVAGMYPTLSATGGASYANNNTKQKFVGQADATTINGASTENYDVSISATYTLFNGFSARRNFERLTVLATQGRTLSRLNIEQAVLSLIQAYYDAAREQDAYVLSLRNLEISKERYERAKAQQEFGQSNKLSVLNAEVDLNTDSITVINNSLNLENAKRNLNFVMGREEADDFALSLGLERFPNWQLEEMMRSARENNVSLLNARENEQLSELDIQIAQSANLPRVDLNADYGFSRLATDAGFLLSNQSIGLTTGFRVSYTIFNGRQRKIQVQNAKINRDISRTQTKELETQIYRDVHNAYATYNTNRNILRVERQNVETAQLNFDRTRDQFTYGQVTSTQFREAQLNLLEAENRLLVAQFNTRVSEVNLLQLSGKLLEEDRDN